MAGNSDTSPTDPPEKGEFVTLFLAHQRRIYRHILALCPNTADAEDLLQETSQILWAKFDQFEAGTSFLAWANRIAHLKVLEHRRSLKTREVALDADVVERLAEVAETHATALNNEQDALAECVNLLKPADRQLVDRCYAPDVMIKDVAEDMQRPVNSVYKSLSRIRRWLLDCTRRVMNRTSTDEGSAT